MTRPKPFPQDPQDPQDPEPDGTPFGIVRVRAEGVTYQPAVKPVFCDTCGGREFWQLPGGRWMCSKCKPQPAARKPAEPTPKPYPTTAAFYPLMAIQAARRASKIGGGFRAWVIGKALDAPGLGMVKRAELQALAQELGVNLRTWQRWVNEARANDLITDIQKGDDWYFILSGYGRAAVAMGLENIGNRKAIIDLSLLVSKGWKSKVFSAWEDGKQITREQIQKTINVSGSTQRYRDNQAGTERQRNYSKSRMKADKLPGLKEHSNHKGLFILRCGVIAWRLPDTRQSTATEKGAKGRARKINRFIRQSKQEGLSKMRQALTDDPKVEYIRLFNLTEAQRLATQRKIAKRDLLVMDLYQRAREAKTGAVIWTHYPI